MNDVQDAIAELVNRLAEIGRTVVDALDGMDSEQRLIIEFLAENPKVAESLQELSQNLARQRVIGGATEEIARAKEPLIKDEKVRKCAKLWLEINEIYSVTYHKQSSGGSYLELDPMPMRNGYCIMFSAYIDDLEEGATYTATELCGEEEE